STSLLSCQDSLMCLGTVTNSMARPSIRIHSEPCSQDLTLRSHEPFLASIWTTRASNALSSPERAAAPSSAEGYWNLRRRTMTSPTTPSKTNSTPSNSTESQIQNDESCRIHYQVQAFCCYATAGLLIIFATARFFRK